MKFSLLILSSSILVSCSVPEKASDVSATPLTGIHRLSTEHRRLANDAGQEGSTVKLRDLPPRVVTLCADHQGHMADIGESWRAGCIVLSPPLPSKRLIWASQFQDVFLIHYESGGYAHSFHLMLVRYSEGSKAEELWHAISPSPLVRHEIGEAINSNALDDYAGFAR